MDLRLHFSKDSPKSIMPFKFDFSLNVGKRVTKPTEENQISRKTFLELEQMFYTEPILNTGINGYQVCLETMGYSLASKDVKIQEELKFLERKTQLKRVTLYYNPRHLGIFGNAFTEYLWNEGKTHIVNFGVIDPKQMNFKRDKANNLLFDELGNPEGYVQTVPINSEQIPLTKDQCEHIHIGQVNPGQMGVGFIEPVFNDSTIKENIEQAKGESAFKTGYVPLGVPYGEPGMDCSDVNLKKIADELGQTLTAKDTESVAYPYYMKPEYLKYPELKLTDELIYSTKLQAAVLRTPLSLLLQSSSDSGTSFEKLIEFYEISLRGMQKALRVEEIVAKYLEKKKLDDTNFEVVWGKLSEQSMKEQVMKIYRLGKTKFLKPDNKKIQEHIFRLLGVPFDEKDNQQ